MTENENTESESTIEIDLAAPDAVAYDELIDEFSVERIQQDIDEVVRKRLRVLYDNRDELHERVQQEQQAAMQR